MSPVRHDPAGHRFVMLLDGAEAFLEYTPVGEGRVDFHYTFVPPRLRGRGVGSAVVREALEWARTEGLRVVPSCWFAAGVIRRHSEYRDLVE